MTLVIGIAIVRNGPAPMPSKCLRKEESAVLSAFSFSVFRALGGGIDPCLVTNSFRKLVAPFTLVSDAAFFLFGGVLLYPP